MSLEIELETYAQALLRKLRYVKCEMSFQGLHDGCGRGTAAKNTEQALILLRDQGLIEFVEENNRVRFRAYTEAEMIARGTLPAPNPVLTKAAAERIADVSRSVPAAVELPPPAVTPKPVEMKKVSLREALSVDLLKAVLASIQESPKRNKELVLALRINSGMISYATTTLLIQGSIEQDKGGYYHPTKSDQYELPSPQPGEQSPSIDELESALMDLETGPSIERINEKLKVLQALAAKHPGPIANVLKEVFDDLVRVSGMEAAA
jgi:hypothetical protein